MSISFAGVCIFVELMMNFTCIGRGIRPHLTSLTSLISKLSSRYTIYIHNVCKSFVVPAASTRAHTRCVSALARARLCARGLRAMTLNYPLTTLEGIKSVGSRNFAAPPYDDASEADPRCLKDVEGG